MMFFARAVLLAASICLNAARGAVDVTSFFNGPATSGDATYYVGNTPNCDMEDWLESPGFTPWAAVGGKGGNLWPVAIGAPSYDGSGSRVCGMCVALSSYPAQVKGPDPIAPGQIVYAVVDNRCAACSAGSLDFRDGVQLHGRYPQMWYPVQCPVGDEPFSYKTRTSTIWFLKLQIRNTRVPVETVGIDINGDGVFTPLTRTLDNFWAYNDRSKEGNVVRPVDLKITSVLGDTVFQRNLAIDFSGKGFWGPGSVQFPYSADYRVANDPSNPIAYAAGATSHVANPPASGGQSCVAAQQKCGGTGYRGPQKCCNRNFLCKKITSKRSVCKRRSSAETTLAPTPPGTPYGSPSPTQGLNATDAPAQMCSGPWDQCGGANWSGPTCCSSGLMCTYKSEWYSQCLQH